MLIHRVAGLGVVADGILGGHPQAASLFVQMAGFLAKAVEVVVFAVHLGEVGQTADLIFLKGALPQILIDQLAGFSNSSKWKGFLNSFKVRCAVSKVRALSSSAQGTSSAVMRVRSSLSRVSIRSSHAVVTSV